ncbi:MAG: Pyruvate kinase [Ignavibacteriae bacterium]|nr:MAG: Pyruvate kinase [Ignavibacteriota bacterium]
MKLKYIPKTKIICTLGPATAEVSSILKLMSNGMDAVRLNFSHGNYSEHRKYIQNLRIAEAKSGQPIAIIQDLQGPKIRVGKLIKEPVKVFINSQIVLSTRVNDNPEFISVDYEHLHKELKRGDKLYIDDGKIKIEVLKVEDKRIYCKVLNTGEISSHKGINLPNVKLGVPSITDKDKKDILFGLKNDIDFIALSFVRSSNDIDELREFIIKHSKKFSKKIPYILAKIEKQEAINDLDNIIIKSDGVLIARGDLGIEIPIENVPLIQKEIIKKCREYTKPVIVATQMLESMIKNPLPTRAEVSDVANAVLDGADAVLLSGETSIGNYPIEAVEMMNKIIQAIETGCHNRKVYEYKQREDYDALAESAVMLSDEVGSKAIIAVTYSGRTATFISKYRPAARIFGFTESIKVARRLSIQWGVESFVVPKIKGSTDSAFNKIHNQIISKRMLKKGDKYVVLAGLPFFEKNVLNTIKVFKV